MMIFRSIEIMKMLKIIAIYSGEAMVIHFSHEIHLPGFSGINSATPSLWLRKQHEAGENNVTVNESSKRRSGSSQ